jgi:hypothetical protein
MKRQELIAGLRNGPAVLRGFVESMGSEALGRRVKDFWTITEHLEHLVVTQRMLLGRLQQFVAEEKPTMRPYVPSEAPAATKAAEALLAEFEALRAEQLALIEGASDAVWARKGVHPEYKDYGFEILVRHAHLHDYYHMCRMEDLWIMKEDLIPELK